MPSYLPVALKVSVALMLRRPYITCFFHLCIVPFTCALSSASFPYSSPQRLYHLCRTTSFVPGLLNLTPCTCKMEGLPVDRKLSKSGT